MTGTMAEIQGAINQLNTSIQKVLGNQQIIVDNQTKLNSRTVKLTHETERKQIEYSPQQRLKNQEY
ncbi:5779_t:CDS:2 [Funneliformis mosseae]|uniref:5779_t:CDS:1 n=1 Tax=Funneliformis mosseae TaxID=27381 RepID=A0A9N9D8C8_FUNMO|nr:5779_t:CDS:2 [Funneliformis mosseae]